SPMRTISLTMLALVLAACPPRRDAHYTDDPRAGRDQCDYAAKHIAGLKIGHPLDDNEQAQFKTTPDYATFMQKCPAYSSLSVQCLIDAPTTDAASKCK